MLVSSLRWRFGMKSKVTDLPKGIRYSKGSYEARKTVNGVSICLHGKDLDSLVIQFNEAVEMAKNSIDYKAKNMTLDEWFEDWFSTTKVLTIKETSVAPMKRKYVRTFGFYLGSHKLGSLMPMDIQGAINAMDKDGIAVSTIMDVKGLLHQCLDAAVANRYLQTNPCVSVVVPKKYKNAEEEKALTEEEQKKFLAFIDDSWYKEMFYFMFLTGVRVGELGAVSWDDIDFNAKEIHIRGSLSCNYCDGVKTEKIVTPKTACSIRTIPFMGEMEEMLISQKSKVERLKKSLGDRYRSHGFENLIFVTGMGSPCSRYIVEKEINKTVERMNEESARLALVNGEVPVEVIGKFHPHSIRHTFATRCAEKGIDVKVAQKLLGHSNITITLNVYTHVNEARQMIEFEKFGCVGGDFSSEDSPTAENLSPISSKSHF